MHDKTVEIFIRIKPQLLSLKIWDYEYNTVEKIEFTYDITIMKIWFMYNLKTPVKIIDFKIFFYFLTSSVWWLNPPTYGRHQRKDCCLCKPQNIKNKSKLYKEEIRSSEYVSRDLRLTPAPAPDRGKTENTSTWCQALPGTPVCQFPRFVVTCRISVVFPEKHKYVFVSCFHHLNQWNKE